MRRAIVLPFLMALLISSVPAVFAPSPLTETIVGLEPAVIELGPEYCVGEIFTLAAVIDDVEELAGLGLQITWNTTYLEYLSHIVMMPVESYPDGIMHSPILMVADMVNEVKGTYDCAASTLGGAPFYGSGVVFEITFRVKYQPIEPGSDVSFQIRYTLDDLAGTTPCGLGTKCVSPHSTEHSNVTIHANPQLALSVDSFPLGVSFIVEDNYRITPWSDVYGQGCSVYLMMPETWIDNDVAYFWDSWSDGYEYRTRMVSMTDDTILTAIYKIDPPVGGISVSIGFGKFSSWTTSTLLLLLAVITLTVKWKFRRKKN